MEYRPATTLRHTPKQPRGARTVDQILESAEAVFSEVGYEHASTNAVAVRAGVSIGSLYQFFAGKDAILETMAQRYLELTRREMVMLLEPTAERSLHKLLQDLLDKLLELQEQRPYFLQCLGYNYTYEAVAGSVRRLNTEMVGMVVALFGHYGMQGSPAEINRRADISVRVGSALLPLALASKGQDRVRITAEIITLLERYLQPELNPGRTA